MVNWRAAGVVWLVVAAAIVAGVGGADDVAPPDGPRPVIPDQGVIAGSTTTGPETGETVKVGVIGTRFDRSHPALTGRVGDARRIGGVRPFAAGGDHGTAIAEIVAERSPSATLYLAALGPAPTPDGYARAVEWLEGRDVDVIVDAGSYFPRTARGLDRIERVAEQAADDGVAFVTSAGNYANRHWRGTTDDRGWVSFASSATRNRLGTGAISGRVTLRLYWEGTTDYDLYLYRRVPDGEDRVVARSTREAGGAEAIDTVVGEGEYYVRVYADDAGGNTVDLFAANHRLAHADSAGSSLPPATSSDVIAVGAVGPDGERAYSSTTRDVTAPDGVETTAAGRLLGSSAAAPIVASTVTSMLVASDRRELSPTEIRRILTETADGSADRLDTAEALARVRNTTTVTGSP